MFYIILLSLSILNSNIWYCNALINAADASSDEFPFVVSLRNSTGEHYCGGALITRKHIVTAAHCVHTDDSVFGRADHKVVNEKLSPADITVLVDTVSPQTNPGKRYQVEKITHHPQYDITNFGSIEYDVAVIELKEEITLTNVEPIERATANPSVGEKGVVPGWGIDDPTFNMSKLKTTSTTTNLKKLEFDIVDPTKCNKEFVDRKAGNFLVNPLLNTASMFCAYAGVNSGACVRDSGSPIVVNKKLVGLVTYGSPCAKNISDIFTSVPYYKNFIDEHIGS